MRKYINALVFVAGLAFLASCSTSINEKLIVGKWNREKINSFQKHADPKIVSQSKTSGKAGPVVTPAIDPGDSTGIIAFQKSTAGASPDELRKMKNQIGKGMEFHADKTAIMNLNKSVIEGKWKMNSKGDKITITDSKSNETQKLNLVKIDSLRFVISVEISEGILQVGYIKQ